MEQSDNRDVVVIGSGIGGLTAAAILAKAGLRVAVYEAQGQPGGYLCGFERQGFAFDTAIQWLNQCRADGFVHRLFRYLGDDFPTFRPLTRISRIHGSTFDYVLTATPRDLQDRLIRDFPADEKGIRAFFRDAEALGGRWEHLNNRIRSPATMGTREKLAHGFHMLGWCIPMMRHILARPDRGLARYFHDPALRNLFCWQESFIAMLMPVAWAFIGNFHAPPAGGSRAMVDWLCGRIRAAGSEVVLNRRVSRVLLNERREAAGVVLADGETVRARHVVAAGDLRTLYEEMLPPDAIPKRLRTAVRTADLYYSHFTVFLGLDCDPAALGFGEEVLYLTREDVPRAEQFGGDPVKTALTVLAPSVRDPSAAPAGKGTLTIHCPATLDSCEAWHTDAGWVRGDAYRAFKKQFAETLVRRVEDSVAPGLRSHVELMEAATPVTYWRYTGNAGGSIMGTRPTGRNIRAGVSRCTSPLRNLLAAGHWADYGGGVPTAMQTGANTALLILTDRRLAAGQTLKDVLDGKG